VVGTGGVGMCACESVRVLMIDAAGGFVYVCVYVCVCVYGASTTIPRLGT
jgi:hypothetical protein